MATIAVFDSGLGSLSIIEPIKKLTKCKIIYFADQKNFPYGKKTSVQLKKIIEKSVLILNKKFHPDLIIIASNTPTILLKKIFTPKLIGILPPLKAATKISKSKRIAILTTQSVAQSSQLSKFIKKNQLPKNFKIKKINCSSLIELVESGKFIANKIECREKIRKTLGKNFSKNKIDVAILSSTHLPFLRPFLENEFPNIRYIDPAEKIAKKIKQITKNKIQQRNSLKIFCSKNPRLFEKKLKKIGIQHKVNFLSLS